MIHDFFNWCVWVLEVIGHQTGWGYELANIIIFVIVQPALILLFFLLWRTERKSKATASAREGSEALARYRKQNQNRLFR